MFQRLVPETEAALRPPPDQFIATGCGFEVGVERVREHAHEWTAGVGPDGPGQVIDYREADRPTFAPGADEDTMKHRSIVVRWLTLGSCTPTGEHLRHGGPSALFPRDTDLVPDPSRS